MKLITTHHDVAYYVSNDLRMSFMDLPWGKDRFCCYIIAPNNNDDQDMEYLIGNLPYAEIDWAYVNGTHAEYWHDRIDQASVDAGVQEKVGDGKPVTTWDEDLHSINDFEDRYCHGSDCCLIIVANGETVTQNIVNSLKNKIIDG